MRTVRPSNCDSVVRVFVCTLFHFPFWEWAREHDRIHGAQMQNPFCSNVTHVGTFGRSVGWLAGIVESRNKDIADKTLQLHVLYAVCIVGS